MYFAEVDTRVYAVGVWHTVQGVSLVDESGRTVEAKLSFLINLQEMVEKESDLGRKTVHASKMLTPRLSIREIVGLPKQQTPLLPNFVLSKLHKELGCSFKPFEKGRDWSDEDIQKRILAGCPRGKLEGWLQASGASPPATPPRLLKKPEVAAETLAAEVVAETRRRYFQTDKVPAIDFKGPSLSSAAQSGRLGATRT